jgi:outer membrane protein TolC
MVLGFDQSEEIDVDGTISYIKEDIPDKTKTISDALTNNIDIKVLDLKKDVDEAFIDIERADYWPTLAAFGNYTRAGSADDFKFQNYSSAMVGLNFSMNLFKGLRTSHKEQQAKITKQQTEEQYLQLKDFISMQVKMKILELERVQSNIEAQERNVKLAERANEISQVRYKEGTGNQLEIQNADMALRQARINKLQSEYDYMNAKFELEQLLGKLEERFVKKYLIND